MLSEAERPIYEFQPTPPRGRRPETFKREWADLFVSTHASARDATAMTPRDVFGESFQPTPPRGRRPAWKRLIRSLVKFQPTPPRGRRRSAHSTGMGSCRVSTHASAREATPRPCS